MKDAVLLIEDDKLMRVTVEDALRAAGYDVVSFEEGKKALAALGDSLFDVAVTDVKLPDLDGFEIVRAVTGTRNAPVIVMTAFGTIKDAVEAMRLGAFDYITKPFSLEEFLLLVGRAMEVKKLRDENFRLKRDIGKCFRAPNIVGESQVMKHVFSLVDRVAATDSTVLILGESGTGKELIASAIHYQSGRKDKPLIKVNCAALPEGLIESELFGHERGAFTGAVKRKPGRFELADGGTIFLDEVGDLPPAAQAKLLRVLQERTIERIGGTESIKVDVRLIAATNKSLEDEVKAGRFREDLFYRLNVIPITLPPLRERREDIPALAAFFLERYGRRLGRTVRFSKEALESIMSHDFPGNVRELENVIERTVTLATSDVISRDDLPTFVLRKENSGKLLSLSDVAAEAEKEHILNILGVTAWNKTRAAEMLGISRKTLWEKLKAYGIEA
ncbi:MAG: sigma-54 dependent transcriptional regulator [Nitrospirota bacterium]